LRTWHVIVLGIIAGVTIIYLPQLMLPAAVPSLAGPETSREGMTAVRATGIEEGAGAELSILVAIAGLGLGSAFAAYLLSRGRE
jgi:hypothetical protein